MSPWLISAIFLLLFAAGTPLFVCMGLACVMCIVYISHADPGMLFQQIFTLTDHDALIAIPFFVLASTFMTSGSSARRIVRFTASLTEWLPGGLGIAAVASCVFFSAMCGLSPAAIVAVGTIMMPGLLEAGWPDRFSLGLITSAGSVGILLPPSLVMIVLLVVASGAMEDYNSAVMVREAERAAAQQEAAATAPGDDFVPAWAAPAQGDGAPAPAEAQSAVAPAAGGIPAALPPAGTIINIKNLFTAAAGPALLIAGVFCTFAAVVGLKSGARRRRFSTGEFGGALWGALPSLVLPAVAAGGIMSGKLTVLQAAAATAVCAFLLETVVLRSVPIKKLPGVFREAGAITGMILIILSVTFVFNWFLTSEGLPIRVSEFILAHFKSKLAFLITVNILFLFLGCIMDILSAVFITVPLLLPAAVSLGIDPVHFCIIFVANFEIGYLTPPVGLPLFTAGAVFRKDLVEVSRAVMPFLGVLLIALAVITYFPSLSLWLVRVTGG